MILKFIAERFGGNNVTELAIAAEKYVHIAFSVVVYLAEYLKDNLHNYYKHNTDRVVKTEQVYLIDIRATWHQLERKVIDSLLYLTLPVEFWTLKWLDFLYIGGRCHVQMDLYESF